MFIIRKNGSVEGRSTADRGPNADGLPLAILVDKGTASAAEVFAAALRYAKASEVAQARQGEKTNEELLSNI